MALTLEAVKDFTKKLLEADYEAQFAKYGDTPQDELIAKLKALGELFVKGVKTRIALLGGAVEQRKDLVRRKVFAYASFEEPTHGEVWAIYLSPNYNYGIHSLSSIYYVAEIEGHPKIVTKQSVETDGDAASIRNTDGEPAPKSKKAKQVEILERPKNPGEAKLLPK